MIIFFGIMTILSFGKYSVCVYPEYGQPHHLPHCHVRWPDGNVKVALPDLMIIVGGELPREARTVLLENLDEICRCWNQLNPLRTV